MLHSSRGVPSRFKGSWIVLPSAVSALTIAEAVTLITRHDSGIGSNAAPSASGGEVRSCAIRIWRAPTLRLPTDHQYLATRPYSQSASRRCRWTGGRQLPPIRNARFCSVSGDRLGFGNWPRRARGVPLEAWVDRPATRATRGPERSGRVVTGGIRVAHRCPLVLGISRRELGEERSHRVPGCAVPDSRPWTLLPAPPRW